MRQMIEGQFKVSCDVCKTTSGTITLAESQDICEACESKRVEADKKKAKGRAQRELHALRHRAERELEDLLKTKWILPWNTKKFKKDLDGIVRDILMFSEQEKEAEKGSWTDEWPTSSTRSD